MIIYLGLGYWWFVVCVQGNNEGRLCAWDWIFECLLSISK